MAADADTVRVAITQIPDIHLFPRWDKQYQVEHPYRLEVERVHSRSVLARLAEADHSCDIGILASEPPLSEYPQDRFERVIIGSDTVSLVVQSDDPDPRIAGLGDGLPYLSQRELAALLGSLDTHELLMLERTGGLNVYVTETLLAGLVQQGRVGPRGCRVVEEAGTNEALVGGLLGAPSRVAIVTNAVLGSVELPRTRVRVLPVIKAPLRFFYMLRRRPQSEADSHGAAVQALWNFLLDFIGAPRGAARLGTNLPAPPPRSEAFLIGIDIVGFSLMRGDQQRTAVRLLNAATRQVIESVEPVRDSLRKAISTGDGLLLVIDSEVDAVALFDAAICLHMAVTELLQKLGETLAVPGRFGARMAVHAGPVLTVDDPSGDVNFVGPGVNDLQRVLDFGDAGHILASDQARERLDHLDGFNVRPGCSWTGWDKHGIGHRVHAISDEQFGNESEPSRLNLWRTRPEPEGAARSV